MALLDAGKSVEDGWAKVEDGEPLPEGQPALVSLARFQSDGEALAGRNAPLGVLLPSNTKPEAIADLLDRVMLVAIQFPVSKDGRGFTIARALRERYRYTGEIRAVGHTLPDQYVHLLRCGFTTVETPEGTNPARWTEALGFYDIAYQPAITDDPPLSLLRRHLAVADLRKPQ
jgi:uncharacterized protein (DUF934 family)